MFSSQQTDPVSDGMNLQDLLLPDLHDHAPMDGNNINHQANKARIKHQNGKGRSSFNNPSSSTADGKDDQTNKRLIHRENEKQRRKQMSNLYASVRSLLPHDFIKGKRSRSDQMEQAEKYIKHMKENIKVLGVKRDQLKNLSSMDGYTNERLMNLVPNTVVVKGCNGGIEIVINSCSIQDGFLLSRVLKTLVEEGLNIISCTTNRANERVLHIIQSEVNNQASIESSLLQQRLAGIANNWPDSY